MVRFKNRYVLFELRRADDAAASSANDVTAAMLFKLLRDAVQVNFGDHGTAAIQQSFNVKYFSPVTGVGIVRVARDHYRLVWATLTLVRDVGDTPGLFTVLHVGDEEAALFQLRETVERELIALAM